MEYGIMGKYSGDDYRRFRYHRLTSVLKPSIGRRKPPRIRGDVVERNRSVIRDSVGDTVLLIL